MGDKKADNKSAIQAERRKLLIDAANGTLAPNTVLPSMPESKIRVSLLLSYTLSQNSDAPAYQINSAGFVVIVDQSAGLVNAAPAFETPVRTSPTKQAAGSHLYRCM